MALLNINPNLVKAGKAIFSPSAPGSLAGGGLINKLSSALSAKPSTTTKAPKPLFAYGNTNVPPAGAAGAAMLGVPQSNQLYGVNGVNVGQPVGIKAAAPANNIKPASTSIAPKFTQDPNNPNFLSQSAGGSGAPVNALTQQVQDMLKAQQPTSQPQVAGNQAQTGTQSGFATTVPSSANTGGTTQGSTQAGTGSSPGGLYGALIAALAGRGLQDSSEVQKARQALLDSQTNEANQLALNAQNPIPLEFQQGRGQVLQNQFTQQQAALSNALQSATQTQGQQIGALQGAAGLAQPVSQFGMLTNPITGQPLNTGVFQAAVSQAQQLVNNGVPANDPSVQQLLSPFGFVGPLAFNQAMSSMSGGNWNPAAQSVAAGQNLSFQGQTQAQAQNLGIALNQLDALQPKVLDFLNSSPLNPSGVPIWNEQISKYLAEMNNAGLTNQWASMTNEIQNIAQKIISVNNASGTPTSATEMAAAQDPSSLRGDQLKAVLDTWSNLGKTNLGVYQQQFGQAGGAGNAYLGGSAQTGQTIGLSPSGPGYTDPTLQGIGGIFWNILSSPAALAMWIKSIL